MGAEKEQKLRSIKVKVTERLYFQGLVKILFWVMKFVDDTTRGSMLRSMVCYIVVEERGKGWEFSPVKWKTKDFLRLIQ